MEECVKQQKFQNKKTTKENMPPNFYTFSFHTLTTVKREHPDARRQQQHQSNCKTSCSRIW